MSGKGGERLRLRFGLIIVSTTFIVCGQVVKLTVAYKKKTPVYFAARNLPSREETYPLNGERARVWTEDQCFSCRLASPLTAYSWATS